MPVSNSFGNQAPYQYYDNTDPASMYDAKGTRKSDVVGNAAESAVYNIAGKVPIFGAAISAAHGISDTLRKTNTGGGDFTGGFIDPLSQAFQDWGNMKGRGGSTGDKVKGALTGVGDILLGPVFAGIDSLIQGNKRRAEEAKYQDQQNYYKNAGYDYALNNNGISYSTNNRPVNNTNQPKQMPALQAGLAGLGAAGGDLLKQLLAKHQTKVPTSLNDFSSEYRQQLPQTDASATDRTQLPFGAVPPAPPTQITPPTGDEAMQGNGSDPSAQGGNILSGLGKGLGILGESGGGGADIGSSLGDVFGSLPMGFEDGGVAHVKGGNGDDDIALVHAGTGKDTGVRVEKGEMIVFSDENVKALNDAVKSGDKEKAFSLIADQLSKRGKQMGTTNYSDGGKGTTTGELSDAEIDKLITETRISAQTIGDYTKAGKILDQLNTIQKRRGEISQKLKIPNRSDFASQDDYERAVDSANGYSKNRPALEKEYKDLGEQVRQLADPKYKPANATPAATPAATQTGLYSNNTTPTHENVDPNVLYNQQRLNELGFRGVDKKVINPDGMNGVNTAHATAELLQRKYENGNPMAAMGKDGKLVLYDVNKNPLTKESVAANNPDNTFNDVVSATEGDTTNPTAPKKDLKSNTVVGADVNNKEPYDWASALNYGTDAAKFAVGMIGAQTPLPTWQVPGAWTDYSNHMKYLSNTGLSGADKALARNNADNTYLTSLERNRNIGGGNAGTIIAADNMANVNHNRAALELASADHQANLRNLGAYGGVVQQDLNNTRTMYNDEYSKAMMTKQSGAALANKAQDDAAQQLQVDKYYGANSDYAKLMQIELEQKQAALDAQKSNNTVNLNRDGSKTPSTSTGNSATDNYIAAQKYLLENKDKKLYTQNADGSYAAINQ